MRKLRVLVANEPRSYREAMSYALKELRPEIEVFVVEPEELDRETEQSLPDLVLCSHATPAVENKAPAWIVFYPECEPLTVISFDGLRLTAIDDIGLSNLLWIVDHATPGPGG